MFHITHSFLNLQDAPFFHSLRPFEIAVEAIIVVRRTPAGLRHHRLAV